MSGSTPRAGGARSTTGPTALVVTLALLLGLVVAVPLLLTDDPECGPGYSPDVLEARGPGGRGALVAARAALAAGWRDENAVTAVAVAGAESSYNPTAANGQSTARGLWQIMLSYHSPKFAGADWRDPTANARVAHTLWRASGWRPWVAYTSGAYRTYLPEARTAVRQAQGDSTTQAAAPAAAPAAVPAAPQLAGLQPVARAAVATVRSHFNFAGTIGGFSDRNIAGTSTTSKHALGLAMDIMTSDPAVGDPIAAYFAGPAYDTFGVENVIWRGRIYNKAKGWHAYRHPSGSNNPTLNHMDHVHVDFRSDAAAPVSAAPPADGDAAAAGCSPLDEAAALGGPVVYPLASGATHDRRNYGSSGSNWARGHTGTDYSVACGTPVRAVHAGVVSFDRNASWSSSRGVLKVATGTRSLTTWYAHMRSYAVADGDQVQPGQTLGAVGAEGNSTGCHLHLEVHPRNGSIYEDGVNPSRWLADNVGRDAATNVAVTSGPLSVTQFNVKNRAAAVARALDSRPTVLGLNEAHRLVRGWRASGRVPGGYTLVAAAGDGSPGRRQNAILVAPGVRVVSSGVVQLSPAVPGDKFGHDRWALVAVLEVPGHGQHVHIQTHLNAGVRTLPDTALRARAYATSVRNLDALLGRLGAARSLTLAGDMNLGAGSTRGLAWAPVLAAHRLQARSEGIDVVAYRGLRPPRVATIPRGVSDHPAVVARF